MHFPLPSFFRAAVGIVADYQDYRRRRASNANGQQTPRAGFFRGFLGGILAQARTSAAVPTQPVRVDAIIFQEWTKTVATCQHAAENASAAKKFVSMLKENVVGATGVKLRPKVTQGGSENPKPNTAVCDALTDAWALWAKRGNAEVTGGMSLTDVERLCIGTLATSGEFLVQFCYGPDAGPWGFSVRVLDPVRLDPCHCANLGATFIKHGIEFNRHGRPVAYWLRAEAQNDIYGVSATLQKYERVEASQICHGFVREYPEQKRGLPMMRTSAAAMRVLSDFQDAALANARVTASRVGFLSKDKENDSAVNVSQDELPTALPIKDANLMTLGDISGYTLQTPDWQFPDAAIEPFSRTLLRGIASGLNVSYNNLASDLTSVNFSSIRQGALDEREVWKGLQTWFASAFCEPIYNAWIDYSLLAGHVKIKGQRVTAASRERCAEVQFEGRRWAWIDPNAEVSAAEKSINLHLKSRTQIAADNGDDLWDVLHQTAAENEDMKKLGLDPAVKIAGDTNPAAPAAAAKNPADDGANADDDK
jgi:lambda family phage portal protein